MIEITGYLLAFVLGMCSQYLFFKLSKSYIKVDEKKELDNRLKKATILFEKLNSDKPDDIRKIVEYWNENKVMQRAAPNEIDLNSTIINIARNSLFPNVRYKMTESQLSLLETMYPAEDVQELKDYFNIIDNIINLHKQIIESKSAEQIQSLIRFTEFIDKI